MDEATNIGVMPEQSAARDFGSVPFSGRADALFERHLLSDSVVEPSGAYDRQRFEALAHSVRDLLARRWIKTQRTYFAPIDKYLPAYSTTYAPDPSFRAG